MNSFHKILSLITIFLLLSMAMAFGSESVSKDAKPEKLDVKELIWNTLQIRIPGILQK